ncbi:LacI family DNA-binding transcriptional regulator [Microlunatus endophyticus]
MARLAGVSTMTVSRVLNNRGSVSGQTRDRVVDAAEQLNYRPNLAAQALSSGRSRTIGVVTMEEPSTALPRHWRASNRVPGPSATRSPCRSCRS